MVKTSFGAAEQQQLQVSTVVDSKINCTELSTAQTKYLIFHLNISMKTGQPMENRRQYIPNIQDTEGSKQTSGQWKCKAHGTKLCG